MRLSELVAQCDDDPVLMIEDEHGIPRPVTSTDIGVMLVAGVGAMTYVLLEADLDDD